MAIERVKEYFKQYGMEERIIELTIPEMERYSGYKEWVDVCKPKE